MNISAFKWNGLTLLYNLDDPTFYFYDKGSKVHCIFYRANDFDGGRYKAEWRIPGNIDGKLEHGREYAKRMSKLLAPWDVINIHRNVSEEEEAC